ncbi:MAG: leucyl/phenylalanyl-tRNA--protein transferase [Thiotrichales bacterium]
MHNSPVDALTWLDPADPDAPFPPVDQALKEPDGLLAVGGDLSPKRLLNAYRRGIFPWYEDGQPILWWSPDPRAIIPTDAIKISRSLRKTLRNKPYTVTIDQAFSDVVSACAAPRKGARGTWITREMKDAYLRLHTLHIAHSIEVWNDRRELVGGLYGVLVDNVFSGESLFTRERDMSKVALVYLAQWLAERHVPIIDCQLPTDHLKTMGAIEVSREEYVAQYLQK